MDSGSVSPIDIYHFRDYFTSYQLLVYFYGGLRDQLRTSR